MHELEILRAKLKKDQEILFENKKQFIQEK